MRDTGVKALYIDSTLELVKGKGGVGQTRSLAVYKKTCHGISTWGFFQRVTALRSTIQGDPKFNELQPLKR